MIRLFFVNFIKLVMMTTPFLSMVLMLCALWGVAGKTTYADLNGMPMQNHFDAPKAKNYLVNETKNSEACVTAPEVPRVHMDENSGELTNKTPFNEKIDWEHTV